jgi:hypothetical protein
MPEEHDDRQAADEAERERRRREELERALDSGVTELPENQPKGILGETNPDLRKVDTFEPDLNSGISQENDTPVIWLAIVLGYLFFFIPGFVVLWLSKRMPIRTKVVASVVMGVGAIAIVILLALSR